jgi:hypothetical protein
MKIWTTSLRRLWNALLGAVIVLVAVAPPATAATPVPLSATILNTDGVAQAGTVCLERVGTNGCGGTYYTDGHWSWGWNPDFNPAGDYRIKVLSSTMDGISRWYVEGNIAGTTDKSLATPVHLEAGSPSFDFTMVLPAIATVTGRAVTTSGAGIAGLTVTLNEAGSYRSTTTKLDGSYDLGYTRSGSWQIIVPGNADWVRTQTGVDVPGSGAVVVPDLVVQAAASIEGDVTDSVTGLPIPFVDVHAYSADTHSQLATTTTDADGHYRIGKLGTTPLVLRFQDGSFDGYHWTLNDGGNPGDWSSQAPITLAEGEVRVYHQHLAPKAAPAPPAHTLSGTATDSEGHPLAGINVTDGDVTDTTDRLGHWYLDAADGTHTLRYSANWQWSTLFGSTPAWFPEYYPDALALSSATQVTVSGGVGAGNLDTSLARAARVTGSLSAVGSGPAVAEHEIWVYDASGATIMHEPMQSGAGYSVEVPSDVPVHLVARGQSGSDPVTEFLPRWFGDVDTLAASTPIQVGPAATATGKDFHLGSELTNLAPPTISGAVAPGQTLTATTGTWSVHTQTEFDTTWLRDGVAVGTGVSYVLKPADAGTSLRVRVTATNGSSSAQALSATAGVGPLATAVAAHGRSPRARTVRLVVAVSAAGLTPAGTISVRRGSRVVKREVVLAGGRAVVLLRKQPSGRQRYTVSYGGAGQTLPGTSPTVRVRVR